MVACSTHKSLASTSLIVLRAYYHRNLPSPQPASCGCEEVLAHQPVRNHKNFKNTIKPLHGRPFSSRIFVSNDETVTRHHFPKDSLYMKQKASNKPVHEDIGTARPEPVRINRFRNHFSFCAPDTPWHVTVTTATVYSNTTCMVPQSPLLQNC